eukprot:3055442-Prymnesium_polylepis.1
MDVPAPRDAERRRARDERLARHLPGARPLPLGSLGEPGKVGVHSRAEGWAVGVEQRALAT